MFLPRFRNGKTNNIILYVIICIYYAKCIDNNPYSETAAAVKWKPYEWNQDTIQDGDEITEKIDGCTCRFVWDQVLCVNTETCINFPKTLVLNRNVISILQVKNTGITSLKEGDLDNVTGIKSLIIWSNPSLAEINELTFRNMTNLINLTITENTLLKTLPLNIFQGLTSLVNLKLSKNGFNNIISVTESLKLDYMPQIKRITLNENMFNKIRANSFKHLNGAALQELNLVRCSIYEISPKAFNGLRALNLLRLGSNRFTAKHLEELLYELRTNEVNVSTLNLNEMNFNNRSELGNLLKRVNKLKVKHLVLSKSNYMESISDEMFPQMTSLEFLDIRDVGILNISSNALTTEVFPNLKILLIGSNVFPYFPVNVNLSGLEILDISGKDYKTQEFIVFPNNFKGLKSLISLDLSYNDIHRIKRNDFSGLANLQYLGLEKTAITSIDEQAFTDLKRLVRINLSGNLLRQSVNFYFALKPLITLEFLDLEQCQLPHLKHPEFLDNLTKLRYLNVQRNEMTAMDKAIFQRLPSLVGLDISYNSIQPWSEKVFVNNTYLKVAILSDNSIFFISPAMVEDFSTISRVDLFSNIFTCDCFHFGETSAYLTSNNIQINDTVMANPLYTCNSPPSWKDKYLANYVQEASTCTDLAAIKVIQYTVLATILILSIVLGYFAYIYRSYFKHWSFLTRVYLMKRVPVISRTMGKNKGEYKYDVFVSYSSEDRDFVSNLVTKLEKYPPFLKLCIYERDFEIGSVLSNTIADNVSASRKTLLIVSRGFVKSNWCLWEMQLAEFKRIFDASSLIILKLGNIPETTIPLTLKFLLKNRIHIEWSNNMDKEDIFWKKLRNTLAPSTNVKPDKNIAVFD